VALPILKEIYPSENMAVAADEDEETFDADHADYGVESLDGMGYLKRTYFKRSNRDAQQASTLENYDVEYAQMPYFARVGATYLTKNPEAVNPSLHVLGWTDPKAAEIYQQTERTIYAYGFAPDVPDDVLKAPFALYVEKSSSLIDLIKRERQWTRKSMPLFPRKPTKTFWSMERLEREKPLCFSIGLPMLVCAILPQVLRSCPPIPRWQKTP
jgi:hypothetical protein